MSLAIHNNQISSTPKGVIQTITRTLKASLHDEEILTKLKRGELSSFHSFFISATKNFLKLAGSALTALTTTILGINLVKGFNSDDSFFNSWKFMGLLTLGTIAPFIADYNLETKAKQSPAISSTSSTVPVQETNTTKTLEPATVIYNLFKKLGFLSIYSTTNPGTIFYWIEHRNINEEERNELTKRGLEVVEIQDKDGEMTEYLQSFPSSPEEKISQTFTHNGKQVVAGLRINLRGPNGFKEALVNRNFFPRDRVDYQLELQIITKDLDIGEVKLYKEEADFISLDDLCEKRTIIFLPNKKKQSAMIFYKN